MRGWGVAIIALLMSVTASYGYVDERFRVEGLAPGEFVVPASKVYKSYKCTPSDYGGLIWCRKSDKRNFRGAEVKTYTSIAHKSDGQVVYVSHTLANIPFSPSLPYEQVQSLEQEFSEKGLMYPAPNYSRSIEGGLIATWGSISLKPIEQVTKSNIMDGKSTGKGFLVDYLTNFKQSVREDLPVYYITGGYGYLYVAGQFPNGKGLISFRAIDQAAFDDELASVQQEVTLKRQSIERSLRDLRAASSGLVGPESQELAGLETRYTVLDGSIDLKELATIASQADRLLPRLKMAAAAKSQQEAMLAKAAEIRADLARIDTTKMSDELVAMATQLRKELADQQADVNVDLARIARIDRLFVEFSQKHEKEIRRQDLIDRLNMARNRIQSGMADLTSESDKSAARDALAKLASTSLTMPEMDLVAIDAESIAVVRKIDAADEFIKVAKFAKERADEIQRQLETITDDGELIQAIQQRIKDVRTVSGSNNLIDLKTALASLNSIYDGNKSNLDKMRFQTP